MFEAKNIEDSVTALNEPNEKIDLDEQNGPIPIQRFAPVVKK